MYPRMLFRWSRIVPLILFGAILLFFLDGFFGPVRSLEVLSIVVPTYIIGAASILGGVLIAFVKTRIAGYIFALTITGALTITAFISLFKTPNPHAPTVLFFPTIFLFYLEGLYFTIRRKFGLDAFADNK